MIMIPTRATLLPLLLLNLLTFFEGTAAAKCGCEECTTEVWNAMAGEYTCGERIEWLQGSQGLSEIDACRKVAGQEFPSICGPKCNPDRCGLAPTPVTPYPTYVSAPPSPLYCFPPEGMRVTYDNVWTKYKVQVKEAGSPCGPGNNYFSKNSVVRNGNDLVLPHLTQM